MAETVNVNFKGLFDASDIMSKVSQIQGALNKVKLPENLAVNFNKNFGKIEELTNSITQRLTKGFKTKSDVGGLESDLNKINTAFDNLYKDLGKVQGLDLGAIIKPDPKVTKQIDDLNKKLRDTAAEIQKIQSQGSGNIEKIVGKFTTNATQRKGGELLEAYNEGDLERVKTLLGEIDALVARTAQRQGENQSANTKANINNIQELKNAIAAIEAETGPLNNSLKQTGDEINSIQTKQLDDLAKTLTGASDAAGDLSQNGRKVSNELLGAAQSSQELNTELEQIGNRVKTFFSLANGIMLFRRALKSAYQTVSDLDKAMTATAVVSSETVSSMWQKLSQYSDAARELGSTMVDVVKAQTLYVQQGLDMEQSMDLANETLKMARVAGIDATNATNAMTAALRGFNMELGKTSGQRVNDVYSRLAQITASDVNELSTAMTKVASIAHSANMEFETTSAFLAQIIETTREAPETAGTALKTVIARFSEVKKLFSEGELMGTDEEGTEIDVNKISTALRTAGINLNEYFTGAKGLDEIFMELAQRWDSLTRIQQRYIATQAAGSRQQSRFIALMQNYSRTTQLVDAAYTSAGSGQEQFEKTLDSLEAKTNQMKTAWQEFVMGLANSDLIKNGIDLLTKLLNTVNGLINTLSGGKGIAKTFVSALTALAGFKLGRGLLGQNGLAGGLTKMLAGLSGETKKAGSKLGVGLATSFKTSFLKQNPGATLGTKLKEGFSNVIFSSRGGEKFQLADIIDFKNDNSIKQFEDKIFGSDIFENISGEQQKAIVDSYDNLRNTLKQFPQDSQQAQKAMAEFSTATEQAGIKVEGLSKTTQQSELNIRGISQAATMAGGALLALSSVFDRDTKSGKVASEVFKYMGISLMAFGAILPVVSSAFSAFGISLSTTIYNIPIIGWIAAIISAIIALIGILNNLDKRTSTEKAQDSLKDLQESIENTRQAVDDLNSSIEEIGNKRDAIDDMTVGTLEWREAVADLNGQILKLVDTYDGLTLGDIKISTEGIMSIDSEKLEEARQLQVTRLENQQQAETSTQIQIAESTFKSAYAATRTKFSELLSDVNTMGPFIGDAEKLTKYEQMRDQAILDLAERGMLGQNGVLENDEVKEFLKEEAFKGLTDDADELDEAIQDFIDQTKQAGYLYVKSAKEAAKARNELDAQYNLYAQQVISNMGLTEGSTEEAFARQFVSGDYIKEISNEIEEELPKGADLLEETDFKLWALNTFGNYNETREGFEYTSNGETKTIDWDSLREGFANYLATNQTEDLFNNNGKIAYNQSNALIRKVMTGESLTQNELNELKNQREKEESDRDLPAIFKETTEEAIKFQNRYREIEDEFFEKQSQIAEDTQKNMQDRGLEFTNNLMNFSNFSNQAKQDLIETYDAIAQLYGRDAAKQWIGVFNQNILGDSKFSDETKQKLSTLFTTVDWSKPEAISQFNDALDEANIGFLKTDPALQNVINKLVELQKVANGFTVNNIEEQILTRADKIKELQGRDNISFTEQEKTDLIQLGIGEDQFSRQGMDDYEYLGGSIYDLIDALNNNTEEQIQDGEKSLQAKLKMTELAEQFKEVSTSNAKNQNSIINGNLDSEEWSSYDALKAIASWTGNQSFVNETTGEEVFLEDLKNSPELADIIYSQFVEAAKRTVPEIANELKDYQEKAKTLNKTADQLRITGGNEDIQTGASLNEAEVAGLNSSNIAAYATYLQEITKKQQETEQLSQALATEIAKDIQLMNQGIEELKSNWESWNAVIQAGAVGTEEYRQALEGLRATLAKITGISKETANSLDGKFFEKNAKIIEKAAEGDTEAISALRKETTKAITFGVDYDPDSLSEAEQEVNNLIDNFNPDDFKIGASLDDSGMTAAFNKLIEDGIMTADQVTSALESIGFEPEIDETPVELSGEHTQRVVASGGFTKVNPDGTTSWVPITNEEEVKGYAGSTVILPTINGKGTKFKGAPKTTVDTNKKTKTSGGGGGGGKDKSKSWENPYDKYYNLEKDINELIRERGKLQDRYNLALRKSTTTSAELRKSLLDQLKTYQTEYKLQTQMLKNRKGQMRDVASETYTDDEGNKRTYKELGVTKYAKYNAKDNTIEIDWAAINKVTDEKEGAAVEAYISRLEELKDLADQAQDSLDAIENSVLDILKENATAAADLAGQLRDAYVTIAQSNIDEMSALNDTISEQNSEIIDGIRESIDLSRQIRENTKKEKELSDMQNRLAYLRRDTSGANALEIKQLEKQLGEARESYVDTLVDQNLDKMSAANDKAEEQRQHQIELMEQQLEYWQKSGYWNEQIEKMISNPKAFQQDILDTLETAGAIDSGILRTPIEKFMEELDLIEQINKAVGGEESAAKLDSKVNDQGYTIYTKDGRKLVNMHYDEQTGTWRNSKVSISESDIDAKSVDLKSHTMRAKVNRADVESLGGSNPSNLGGGGGNGNGGNTDNASKYGKASETTGTIKQGMQGAAVKAIQYALNKLGFGNSGTSSVDGKFGPKTKEAVQNFQKAMGLTADGIVGDKTRAKFKAKGYSKGGLVDYTGMAMVHGSSSKPEAFLNAKQTEMFMQLKDVMSSIASGNTGSKAVNGGDNYFEFHINVDEIASDYDVDQVISKVKKEIYNDAKYRNTNVYNRIR